MSKTMAYYRSSTTLQENSVPMQKHRAFKYCMANNLFLDAEFEDEFISARKMPLSERKGMSALLKEIEKGNVANLIVYKRDRMARSVEEHLHHYFLLKEKKVSVHFTSDSEYPMKYNNFGEVMEYWLGGLCEHEANQINERMMATRIANFELGISVGTPPYGYEVVMIDDDCQGEDDKDNKKKIIKQEEKEVETVKRIFAEFLSGKHDTLNGLRKHLNAENILRRGKEWKTTDIEDVLTEPMYKGIRIGNYSGKIHFHEMDNYAFIDEDDWDTVQELFIVLKPIKDFENELKIRFTLEPIFCGVCGKRLTPKIRMRKGEDVGFYECSEHSVKVHSEWIERKVIDKAQDFFAELAEAQFEKLFERYRDQNMKRFEVKLREIGSVIKVHENHIENIMNKYLKLPEDSQGREKFLDQMLKYQKELEAKQEMRNSILSEKDQVCGFPEKDEFLRGKLKLNDRIKLMKPEQVMELINDIVYRIEVNEHFYGVIFKHPYWKRGRPLKKSLDEILVSGCKGFFYGRVSTDKQDVDLTAQKHKSYQLVESRRCEIIKEYIDFDVSARKKKIDQRPQLTQLLEDLEYAKIDFVIVYNGDRLARTPLDHIKLRKFMDKRDIPVILSAMNQLYNSEDFLAQIIRDAFSKYEADAASERTEHVYEARIKAGKYTGGPAPYGYKYLGDAKFQQIEDKIMMIEKIIELYKSGYGFQAIANKLNDEGLDGNDWLKEGVKSIVTNPFYMGYLTFGRFNKKSHNSLSDRDSWTIERFIGIEPAVSEKDWEQCWEIYRRKSNNEMPAKQFATSYFFKDVIYCKSCQLPLKCRDQRTNYKGEKKGSRIYQCPNNVKKLGKCTLRFDAEELHEYIIDDILPSVYLKARGSSARNLHMEIVENFQRDTNALIRDIERLEKQSEEYNGELRRVDERVHKLYAINKKENEMEVKILLQHRLKQISGIEKNKNSIDKLKKRKKYINNVEVDFGVWKGNFFKMIREEYDLINDNTLRRLILYVFEKIEVDTTKELSYTARIDLELDEPVFLGGTLIITK